jgi:hypothetical protein
MAKTARAALEKIGVDLDILLPLFWKFVLREDRTHRARFGARTARQTGIRIDVEHSFAFVNAIYGADRHASSVLDSKARLGDYIWIHVIQSCKSHAIKLVFVSEKRVLKTPKYWCII